jgi:hypothetical protein
MDSFACGSRGAPLFDHPVRNRKKTVEGCFPRGKRGALQQRSFEQRHRVHHAEGHARRVSARDSGRAESEIGGSEGTAEESPPAGRATDETVYFRLADDSGVTDGMRVSRY